LAIGGSPIGAAQSAIDAVECRGMPTRREILQTLAAAAALPLSGFDRPVSRQAPVSAASGAQPSVVNLFDYEELARKRLPAMAYEYIVGGAGDEITLRANRTSFDGLRLKPRVLRDVSRLDTSVAIFGERLDYPILLAPTAYHKLAHPEGESATARGAGAARATMCVSSFATTSIEDVAKAATAPLWFQLYVQRDRGFTKALVQRAEAAGCRTLVVTCDTPVIGIRNREARARFRLPAGVERENLKGLLGGLSSVAHVDESAVYSALFDPALTWEGIDWIRSYAKVPVVLKGILSPEDAQLAIEHGAHGLIVSNHGARNLDTVPATIDALPGVVDAVGGRIPVLMDGGIRRGTDVVKALAIGAKAVLVGRPYLWALSVGGAEGVQNVMTILQTEFQSALALCGHTSAATIDRSVLWTGRDIR
jgi:4-hydroxymandelate oxidase